MDSLRSSSTSGRRWSSLWAAVFAVLRGDVSAHREQHPVDHAAREDVRRHLSVRGTLR
jgi:hypothetical protein